MLAAIVLIIYGGVKKNYKASFFGSLLLTLICTLFALTALELGNKSVAVMATVFVGLNGFATYIKYDFAFPSENNNENRHLRG